MEAQKRKTIKYAGCSLKNSPEADAMAWSSGLHAIWDANIPCRSTASSPGYSASDSATS